MIRSTIARLTIAIGALGCVALAGHSSAAIVYNTTGGSSFNGVGPITNGSIEGDVFQVSQSGQLSSVAVAIGSLNGSSVSGNIELFSDVNGQLGTELWGGSFGTDALTQQGATYSPLLTFNVTGGPELTTGTNYWLAIIGTGANADLTTNSNVYTSSPASVYGSVASPTYIDAASQAIVAQIGVNPVPLPATAWLMLGGLGGLGAWARKKRAA